MDHQPPDSSEDRFNPRDPDVFTALSIGFELCLIPAAWFLAWIWAGPSIPAAQWLPGAVLAGAAGTLPLLLLLAAITWTPLRRFPPIRRIRNRLRKILGPALADLELWQAAAISVTAGVGEEVLFRGALQGRADLVLTSLLFGMLHWITPTYAVLATLLGAYLGWLLSATGNLLVPIMVHALYDFAALLVFRNELRKQGMPTIPV